MVVGALAALWIAVIPIDLATALFIRFVGRHSPATAIPGIALTLPALALGATWFKKLFYKGMLWGYKPDREP
jgi:hypothetical protein